MKVEYPVRDGRIEGVRVVDAYGIFDVRNTPARSAPIYVDKHGYELWLDRDQDLLATFMIPNQALAPSPWRELIVIDPCVRDGFKGVSVIDPARCGHHFLALGPMDRELLPELMGLEKRPTLLEPWMAMSIGCAQEIQLIYASGDDIREMCLAIADILRRRLLKECSVPGWALGDRARVSVDLAYHLLRAHLREEDRILAAAVIRNSGLYPLAWKIKITGSHDEPLSDEQWRRLEQAESMLASPTLLGGLESR